MAISDIVVLSVFGALAVGLPVLGLSILLRKRKPTGGAGGHKKHRDK